MTRELLEQLQQGKITLREFKERMRIQTDTLKYFVEKKEWV
tara:strand:+ start:296 stop:418 length:123 start_codon:yes stop_codon:yes gene_type:complete